MLRDTTHACWEATASTAVDFPDAWAAYSVTDCPGSGGRHDHRQNASYGVVNLPIFSGFWPQEPYNIILRFLAVKNGGKMIQ